jgi:hypothetical protein
MCDTHTINQDDNISFRTIISRKPHYSFQQRPNTAVAAVTVSWLHCAVAQEMACASIFGRGDDAGLGLQVPNQHMHCLYASGLRDRQSQSTALLDI